MVGDDVIDKNFLMGLEKKHSLLFKTSDVEEVQAFCMMEPLFKFKLL